MTTDPTSNHLDSNLEMQAMLYALGDPSLDRAAFESLLESNCEAMEAVSRAVWVMQGVRSSRVSSITPRVTPTAPIEPRRSAWHQSAWIAGALAIAASLVAFFSLGRPKADPDSSSDLSAIAAAWSDVQTSELKSLDPFPHRELSTNTFESEDLVLASASFSVEDELYDSVDIPSWLITAASRANETTEGTLQ
ncbi:hypothetical protein SH501x_004137 [Pirellulaceae bacterium SH501]